MNTNDKRPSSVPQIKEMENDRKNDHNPQPMAPQPKPPSMGSGSVSPEERQSFEREQQRIAEREKRIQHMQKRLAKNRGKARNAFRSAT